jgi:hypothetical protein
VELVNFTLELYSISGMKSNLNSIGKKLIPLCIFMIFFPLTFNGQPFQTDTLWVNIVDVPPVIDGNPSDNCWDSAAWDPISQVWIPWGGSMDSTDFCGRYKVVWSSSQNLVYVLAEITDDVFVDGYVYKSSPENNNYPDYDVLEVFLDENASKGKHVFDGTGQTGIDWGYNAENAFSYHIMANKPADGDTVREISICDIAGSNWSDEWIANYNTHFPEFALSRQGNHYYWEFSLKVYDEDYYPANPSEENRIKLQSGKIMGLSFAYCDNDEAGTTRDNFIGSVWVPEARYNDHWMNAGDFRAARLTGNTIPTAVAKIPEPTSYVVYNPYLREVQIVPVSVSAQVAIYNIQGMLVQKLDWHLGSQNGSNDVSFKNLPDGIYLIASESNGQRNVTKISVF